MPDHELDAFVDRIAGRLASFDKVALAEAKQLVDQVTLPDDAVFPPALDSFFKIRRETGNPGANRQAA